MIAPKNIVVGTDFGEAAARALQYGVEFARAFGATLHVVHVVDDLAAGAVAAVGTPHVDLRAVQASIEDEARQSLDASVGAENGALDVRTVVISDHQPARRLLEFAREHESDLIIIGTHGRGGIAEFFLGSVAQRVVRNSPCPVLTVRADAREFVGPGVVDAPSGRSSSRLH